jgi:hypothetical protein
VDLPRLPDAVEVDVEDKDEGALAHRSRESHHQLGRCGSGLVLIVPKSASVEHDDGYHPFCLGLVIREPWIPCLLLFPDRFTLLRVENPRTDLECFGAHLDPGLGVSLEIVEPRLTWLARASTRWCGK